MFYPSLNKEDDSDEDDNKDDKDTEDEDDEKEYRNRKDAKNRRDEKYLNDDSNEDEFHKMYSDFEYNMESFFNEAPTYDKVDEPEKRPLFQRIQNKALDNDVKMKKSVAKGKRVTQDARNAARATARIPLNISSAIKSKLDEWEELDDDRRKEFMLKPGYRKNYFRLLKLAIIHGIAFAINPLLNIVVFISTRISREKDIRIRNEFARELEAEIKVTEAKIEDANSNRDNTKKYQLMRIRDKLQAELIRVKANSSRV